MFTQGASFSGYFKVGKVSLIDTQIVASVAAGAGQIKRLVSRQSISLCESRNCLGYRFVNISTDSRWRAAAFGGTCGDWRCSAFAPRSASDGRWLTGFRKRHQTQHVLHHGRRSARGIFDVLGAVLRHLLSHYQLYRSWIKLVHSGDDCNCCWTRSFLALLKSRCYAGYHV